VSWSRNSGKSTTQRIGCPSTNDALEFAFDEFVASRHQVDELFGHLRRTRQIVLYEFRRDDHVTDGEVGVQRTRDDGGHDCVHLMVTDPRRGRR